MRISCQVMGYCSELKNIYIKTQIKQVGFKDSSEHFASELVLYIASCTDLKWKFLIFLTE